MKKNNKGFSLVELIVVILIMAIIGVALTPQIMKWVGNAQKSNDVTNYNSLVSNASLAIVELQKDNKAYKGTITITVGTSSTDTAVPSGQAATLITKADFDAAMNKVLPGWAAIKRSSGSNDYTIVIVDGVVNPNGATPAPVKPDGTMD